MRIVSLLLVLLYSSILVSCHSIRLSSVTSITLHRGKYTTGRRSAPVPQLNCIGGACSIYSPNSVLCRNVGFDGRDVNWKCESDLPSNVKFGTIQVTCEGYEYPDDVNVLEGSCGLEYTLESTGEYHSQSYDSYTSDYHTQSSNPFGTFIMLAVVAFIFYLVIKSCTDSSPGQGYGGSGGGGYGSDYPGGFPPSSGSGFNDSPTAGTQSYKTTSSYGGSTYAPNTSQIPTGVQPNTRTGPGFWSGLLGGAGLAYLFGRRGGGYGYGGGYNAGYGYGPSYGGYGGYGGGGGFGQYFGNTAFRSTSSSGPRMQASSGFGGTKRR